MKINTFILFILLVGFSSAHAQKETACNFPAFVTDPASGVNVRSGAGTDFEIVKTVPADSGTTMFDVVASKGDWLKISYAINSKNERVFAGAGWVYAPLLAVKEKRERYEVFKLPNRRSEKIDISLYDHILPLYGCRGGWAKVRLPVTGTGVGDALVLGWMPSGTHCGNPWIECD